MTETKKSIAQLLVTCMVDAIRPQVGTAVKTILNKNGCEVEFPKQQTCCGQPAFNAGFLKQARAMARHTIDVFTNTSGPVVVPSGSCTDMIVHHYPELLKSDPVYSSKAKKLSERTYEFTQFLVDKLGLTNVGAKYNGNATYHPCCHGLRNLNLVQQPSTLLDNVEDLEQVVLPCAEECCGFGGLFSVRMSEISGAMLDKKLSHIEESGANVLIAGDVGCIIHMQGGLRRRGSNIQVKHIAEILNGCD